MCKPLVLVFLGILVTGPVSHEANVFGEEERARGRARGALDSAQPAIPVSVFQKSLKTAGERQKFGVTADQYATCEPLLKDYHSNTSMLLLFRTDPALGGNSLRMASAVVAYEKELENYTRRQLEAILTSEQCAAIRRSAYGAGIDNESAMKMVDFTVQLAVRDFKIDDYLTADDLLSVLEQPRIQQMLGFSVEQQRQVAAVSEEAATAALEIVREYLRVVNPNRKEETLKEPQAQLERDALALLTEKQRSMYEAIMKQRLEQVAALAAGQEGEPASPELKQRRNDSLPHGALLEWSFQQLNGRKVHHVEVRNAFDDVEIRLKLRLSVEQQKQIASRHKVFHELASRVYADDPGTEPVRSHNRTYQARLAGLLTADQESLLQKASWKELGLKALLKPEISEQLGLNDFQVAYIAGQVRSPAPKLFFGDTKLPQSAEDFQKVSGQRLGPTADQQRQMRERTEAIHNNVWEQLTLEQREQFISLTGYEPPVDSVTTRSDDEKQ